jgi:predicted ATPase/DNA-binding SARP family transcriptional activator
MVSRPDTRGDALRVWLLGGFRAAAGATEIAPGRWRLRKARSLVKLLALAPGCRLHREQLLEALWPDLDPDAAANNLRKTLHHARRALSPAGPDAASWLRSEDDILSLGPADRCWIDVTAFEAAAAEARRSRSIQAYREALALYGGDLLPEDRYEDWTIRRREAVRQDHLALLAELAALHERGGDHGRAIETLQQLLAQDAGREEAHRGLMRLYALAGQRQQALRQYQTLRDAVRREFDADPDAQTEHLHGEIVAGRFPPAGPAPAMPATTGRPAGTVTFLFTDIEGSTQLLADLGRAYADLLGAHHRLLRASFDPWGGQVMDTQGDAFFVAFPRARDALSAAVAAQRAVGAHPWPSGVTPRVRMGLHTGEPVSAETGYVGIDVHRAARICDAAHGGQILLSATTRELVMDDLPEGVGLRDLGEHRLKDLTRPSRLFQVTAADLPADFPPPRSLDRHPNNLPVQLTSFVGRDREITDVKERLMSVRLVTLTGPGGVGKTRLALEVGARVLEAFPDGVWFADLSSLTDAALIPQVVASVFGVHELSGGSLTAALTQYLSNKHCLLILDNCEHLAEACAALAQELLRRCPRVRLLATSRETLGLPGEATYRVPSLSLPDPRQAPDPGALLQYEAIRLFVDRAALSQPAFVVTEDNAATLVQICRHLDGIPLAIELAAARVRALSVEAIAAHLGDRFRLLAGGTRTALARHQTLRAAMDWSYDLLGGPERALLRGLSVFAGGLTLEAAQAVGAPDAADALGVLDVLTALVDKSLVTVDQHAHDVRYRLLETIRQYGREKLVAAGEADAAAQRHREFFHALATRAEPELTRAGQMTWLDRLEAEHDNLRAALEWSLTQPDDTALRLAATLAPYWHARGYLSEGREWLDRAWAQSGEGTPAAALRLRALVAMARLAFAQDDFAATKRFLDEAVPMARAAGDRQALALGLGWLGHATWHVGDRADGLKLCDEALALARTLEDAWTIAVVHTEVATVAVHEGDHRRAAPLIEESLARFRSIGDASGVAWGLYQLGSVALTQSDLPRAAALIEESLTLQRRLGRKPSIAASLGRLGRIALMRGEYDRAIILLEEGVALAHDLGKKEDGAYRNVLIGLAALARGDFARAAALFEDSRALQTEFGSKFDNFDAGTALGMLTRYRGDYNRARRLLEERAAPFRRFKGLDEMTDPVLHLGLVALAQGDNTEAALLLRESLKRWVVRGSTLGMAPVLEGLARVGLAVGDADRAARVLGAADALREAVGTPRWPIDEPLHAREIATLRSSLGEDAFAAAWTAGRATTWQEAAALALADE